MAEDELRIISLLKCNLIALICSLGEICHVFFFAADGQPFVVSSWFAKKLDTFVLLEMSETSVHHRKMPSQGEKSTGNASNKTKMEEIMGVELPWFARDILQDDRVQALIKDAKWPIYKYSKFVFISFSFA